MLCPRENLLTENTHGFSTATTYKASAHTKKLRDGWPSLANSINHAFSSVRHWLVPFLQKFGQNWKVSYWI